MATLAVRVIVMENTSNPEPTTTPQAPSPDDPRFAFAKVVDAVGTLMEATGPEHLAKPTPCTEFTVKELLEHLVLVVRRVAAIGRGEHWSTITEQPTDSGWAGDFRNGAHEIMEAWADPAILDTVLEVPWGEFPGAVLMYTYTAELATHGWDLATATGAEFSIDDDLLHGALVSIKFVPAEGRDHPDVPFGEVVDPGPDAPLLLQIAGWSGRNVIG